MGWLTFISRLIEALAWPIAVTVSAFLFREQLRELLPRLRVKHGDWEASFRLNQAEEAASALPDVEGSGEVAEPTPEEQDTFEKVADVSPRAAILEVRTDIEEAIRSLAKSRGLLTPKVQSVMGLTRLLRSREVLDRQTSALLEDLRVLGNRAAHDAQVDFSKEQALRYKAVAEEAIVRLTALAAK